MVGNLNSGYTFVTAAAGTASAAPATCLSAGTCGSSTSIEYVGTDGSDYSATLVAPPSPLIPPIPTNPFPPLGATSTSVSISPQLPQVGRQVTMTAIVHNSFVPGAGSVSFDDVTNGHRTTLCTGVGVTELPGC